MKSKAKTKAIKQMKTMKQAQASNTITSFEMRQITSFATKQITSCHRHFCSLKKMHGIQRRLDLLMGDQLGSPLILKARGKYWCDVRGFERGS